MDLTSKQSSSTLRIECPFAIQWEIEESNLIALKESKNGNLTTELFDASNIPGLKYHLRIYPNGNNEEDRGEVSILLLVKLEKVMKVNSNFKFIIETADYISKFDYEDLETTTLYGEDLCTTEKLFDPEKKFIVDGKLSLKCHGTLSIEQEIEPADKQWEDNDVGKALWNRGDKDFTIVVDGNSLQAHKCLLGARSPAFDAMFNSGMKEAIENRMVITDFTYEIVNAAIQLCYFRKISSLTSEEKMKVLQFFDKYEIMDLKDSLERSLVQEISLTSVCKIAILSLLISSVNLQKRCHDYMVASIRMNRTIPGFEVFDENFALKVLKNAYFSITKT